MKEKDDLTLLIQSLTKSERKYFTLLASLEGNSNSKSYMELFSQLAGESNTSSKKLKRKQNSEYVLRNYLYEQILFTLREYAEEVTQEMKCDKQMLNIRVLLTKGQFNLAKKEVTKLLKQVREAEMFTHEMEILSVQHEFLSRLLYDKNEQISFDVLMQQELEAADRYKNFRQYFQLYNNVRQLMITKGGGHLSEAEQKNLRATIGHPLLRTELNALSLKAKYFFYLTWQYYYQAEGDNISLYRVTSKLMRFCDKHKKFMAQRPFQYVSAIYTHLQASYDTGHIKEFPNFLEKLNEIPLASMIHRNYRFAYHAYHHYLLLFYKNDSKQLKTLNGTYNNKRDDLLKTIRKDFLMILDLNAMLVDLSNGNYSDLLDKVNAYLNNKDFDIRIDFTAKVMVLNIIAHLESSNYLLVENLMRNAQRFVSSNKTLKNEQRVMKWLKQWASDKMQRRVHAAKHRELLVETMKGNDSDYPVFYKVLVAYAEPKNLR